MFHMENSIEVNDVITTRDNQRLRVLRVVRVGNNIHRLEAADDNCPSPCRVNVPKENFLRILQKCPWKTDKMGNKLDRITGKPWAAPKEEVTK
jgi:hypothetical protein